jgi:iron complex transport system ATP-binding protein
MTYSVLAGGPDTGMVLLHMEALSVGYSERKTRTILLENLSLSIEAGNLICFMGPNGVGKSTLIRTLAGIQNPITGSISAGARLELPFGGVLTDTSKQIALVLTDRITAVNMSVYELVTYGRYPYIDWTMRLNKDDQQAILESIELTRITHLVNKKLYELSDGQLQMAMIARALAQQTPLLLLDEPTAHLDLNNRVEIMNLLRILTRETNRGILVATHELDLALQTADLIWLAGNERNILTGMPEDLVLNGAFDEIFQFKGFDLKTGKVFHDPWRNVTLGLNGEGHAYLWTKNALERSGYRVNDSSVKTISVSRINNELSWHYEGQSFHTLESLLKQLHTLSSD